MEIELVGLETVGWNPGQSITLFELPVYHYSISDGPLRWLIEAVLESFLTVDPKDSSLWDAEV